MASLAAELNNLVLLSRVRSPFLPRKETGSKSLISPAIWTLKEAVSNRLIALNPVFPRNNASQYTCRPIPTGERTPIPLITTLCILLCYHIKNYHSSFFTRFCYCRKRYLGLRKDTHEVFF